MTKNGKAWMHGNNNGKIQHQVGWRQTFKTFVHI